MINWNQLAQNLLKSELKKRGYSYDQLQEKLRDIGVNESVNAISRKINRGTFQFAFFLQCAVAIGIKNLRLDEVIHGDMN